MTAASKRTFESALERVRRSFGFSVYGYNVMPEHVHLLIGEVEHFWQKRYYDFNIRNRRQFVEKLKYIHRNPVKRGLCERPEDWEWSSFSQYATGCEGWVEIESEWTARARERAAGRLCPAVQRPHSSQPQA